MYRIVPQIDTVEDLLETERPILTGGNTIMTRLLRTDPRASVKALKHKERLPCWVDSDYLESGIINRKGTDSFYSKELIRKQ